jgi:hypothetical protein
MAFPSAHELLLGEAVIALAHDRIGDRPPQSEFGIVPNEGKLAGSIVIGILFVMEHCHFGEHDVSVTEFWWNEDLQPIFVG